MMVAAVLLMVAAVLAPAQMPAMIVVGLGFVMVVMTRAMAFLRVGRRDRSRHGKSECRGRSKGKK